MLFYLLGLVVVILMAVFAFIGARNNALVSLDLILFKTQLRISTLMAGLLFTGFVSGAFSLLLAQGKVKLSESRKAKKNHKLEQKAQKKLASTSQASASTSTTVVESSDA